MTDSDEAAKAAHRSMFGHTPTPSGPRTAEKAAKGIASYVSTHPDAGSWSPRRWAYEAVMVILNDEGATHQVLSVLYERGSRDVYDLSIVRRDDGRRRSIAAGMTPREAEVWEAVGRAAGLYLRLTEDEPQHGMEREEICHAFHVVQGWLSGRPFIRAMGFDNMGPPDAEDES